VDLKLSFIADEGAEPFVELLGSPGAVHGLQAPPI
jgi:hypothetical protein